MHESLLFPFLDTAVRVIAILVLCAIPLLIALPSQERAARRRGIPAAGEQALMPD